MRLAKRYDPREVEPRLEKTWQVQGFFRFSPASSSRVYSVDTPPPTVSGHLHLGHVFSYSHPDFIVRFKRMCGYNVFYPMGFDDNGLPTERLVEKRLGITARQVGREIFIQKCLEVSEAAEVEYQNLWKRLGLSIDWRYTYRTIDDFSRRTSQYSFLELYKNGRAYRQEAPVIWCPECQTAIAQAELNDLERESEFVTLDFRLEDGRSLPIATTRPELLPACVAIFVHPEDPRYVEVVGKKASLPLSDSMVPVFADHQVDPSKGTGAVMCCTFGDSTDVALWYAHQLPLISLVNRRGEMTAAAGDLVGLTLADARKKIKEQLQQTGKLTHRQATRQSIRVHERCDTPVEYLVTPQWFIRVLNKRDTWLEAGEKIHWHPAHMQSRYQDWVENLNWDWCISRQRYFGVPFPVWYCQACGAPILAEPDQLPVDPQTDRPKHPCPECGATEAIPDTDVFDTWATSSMSPQIIGHWLDETGDLFEKVFPFSLRPQAHEIIRTWAFYTIVKAQEHQQRLPWEDVLISGWGLAGEGMGKISKSRGGGPMAPLEMIERYSADAVRYWAASTSPGKDAIISEEKIQMGVKLVTKLWNVARFSERFLEDYPQKTVSSAQRSPADRWILSRLQELIRRVTELFDIYDYASAKSEIESFFWTDFADNYIEMSKQRLYDENHPQREGARETLYTALLTVIKLLAPMLPFITDEIYIGLFFRRDQQENNAESIHITRWPHVDKELFDEQFAGFGETLVEIATAVRRYKSEHNLSLEAELSRLQLATEDPKLRELLEAAKADLASITRARSIDIFDQLKPAFEPIHLNNRLAIRLQE